MVIALWLCNGSKAFSATALSLRDIDHNSEKERKIAINVKSLDEDFPSCCLER
jgi:hypothetical protein